MTAQAGSFYDFIHLLIIHSHAAVLPAEKIKNKNDIKHISRRCRAYRKYDKRHRKKAHEKMKKPKWRQ